ncbi:unnamed protein product [Acanthoscelides obtectus]|uniref:Uncharacterized protein n=1 Tax=Acanthoscelides obtectus TaxID=200917 RepID=A0A9P0JWA1_ACAOB|nr:unnamed protein product [Acanthoscelides obtectus]CAK1648959.1 hypothetical protein AOBTE_LOCUS15974 [Acanthoscelides obtectus]
MCPFGISESYIKKNVDIHFEQRSMSDKNPKRVGSTGLDLWGKMKPPRIKVFDFDESISQICVDMESVMFPISTTSRGW